MRFPLLVLGLSVACRPNGGDSDRPEYTDGDAAPPEEAPSCPPSHCAYRTCEQIRASSDTDQILGCLEANVFRLRECATDRAMELVPRSSIEYILCSGECELPREQEERMKAILRAHKNRDVPSCNNQFEVMMFEDGEAYVSRWDAMACPPGFEPFVGCDSLNRDSTQCFKFIPADVCEAWDTDGFSDCSADLADMSDPEAGCVVAKDETPGVCRTTIAGHGLLFYTGCMAMLCAPLGPDGGPSAECANLAPSPRW